MRPIGSSRPLCFLATHRTSIMCRGLNHVYEAPLAWRSESASPVYETPSAVGAAAATNPIDNIYTYDLPSHDGYLHVESYEVAPDVVGLEDDFC
jgi:hypothetical protein